MKEPLKILDLKWDEDYNIYYHPFAVLSRIGPAIPVDAGFSYLGG